MNLFPQSTLSLLLHYILIPAFFKWFNLLVYHLNCGKYKWSPTSSTIKQSMISVRSLIQEKTRLKVDQPDILGGTISTGSVARRAFSNECYYIECCLSVTKDSYKEPLYKKGSHTIINNSQNFNSDMRINTFEFGNLCKETYMLILDSFPWANI